ncbi:lactonase family protein [Tunturiibacter gelidiferens]
MSKGIYRSIFDSALGQLTPPVLIAATARPSYLAVSPPGSSRRSLYAVNAINDPAATVTSFMLDPGTGNLQQTGQVPSGGAGPAYVSVDSTGHAAFVANYVGASITSYRVQPDGTLSQPVERLDFKDHQKFGAPGPNSARQENSHPHCVTISPDDRFLLVCDLGTDHISVFYIHPETGQLSDPHLFTNERPGSGPRHVVFHPNGRWVYCINEIDSSIDRCLWTATRFSNAPQGLLVNSTFSVKTIAPDFPAEKNTAAEIAISPDGNFLYASNRGKILWSSFRLQKTATLRCFSGSPAAAKRLATLRWIRRRSGCSAAIRTPQMSRSFAATPLRESSLAPRRPSLWIRRSLPSSPEPRRQAATNP